MTVSLRPVSQGSGAANRAVSNGCAVDDLEQDLVDVDRVGVRGEVVQLPHLGRAHGRVLRDRVVPAERNACAARDRAEQRVPAGRTARPRRSRGRRCRLVVETRTVSESSSFSDTCRVLVAAGSGRIARQDELGRAACSCRAEVAAHDAELHHLPGRLRIGRDRSPSSGGAAAEGLVGRRGCAG